MGKKLTCQPVEGAFAADVDYAILVKLYGEAPHPPGRYSPAVCVGIRRERVEGRPDLKHVSTSYVERQNVNMCMSMRRLTCLTNGFSKKTEAHYDMVVLCTCWYNFVRIHKTLRMSPALAAGVSKTLWSMEDLVAAIDANAGPMKPRGPC